MRKGILVFVVAVFTLPAALASQPGQPLDCSDWVFLQPGYSCVPWVPYPCEPDVDCTGGGQRATDNQGRELRVRFEEVVLPCGDLWLSRISLLAYDGISETLLAYLQDRCVNPGSYPNRNIDAVFPTEVGIGGPYRANFDPVTGRLLIPLRDKSRGDAALYNGTWVASIVGFAPLFDILETYAPQDSKLGLRVPAHPEGLRSADHFDTYWGHVADLPDFTQAQPVACAYPADHQPQPGEYMTVADTSPTPAPGTGNYVVTAVTNGAQRRYGRQRIGGVLSGRDPALLPGCQ